MKSFNIRFIFFSICLIALQIVKAQEQILPQLGKSPVSDVVKAMTLDEKVSLLVGGGMFVPGMQMPGAPAQPSEAQKKVTGAAGTTASIPRLGIPAIVVCDGPAGIHAFNAGKSRVYYATAWPTGTLLASSWDTSLVKKVGVALGGEAKEYGIDILLGPGMNIHRNPLGARNFEYYSEDPLLTGFMASAMVDGIQSNGVGVSAKHFFANNQETNRNTVNAKISERAIREIYLKGWQLMVKKSNPWTIMSSYNLVNGPHTAENYDLLTTILRKEWGFKGFVMSDWFGGRDAAEMIKAGNNLVMPGMPQQKKAIFDAVKSGKLDEKVVDQSVAELLGIILQSATFKGYKFSDNPPLKEDAKIAREAAAESMILLKNDGKSLPVALGSKLAVFGNNAIELIAGGTGSGDVNKMYTVPLIDGLFRAGYTLNPDLYRAYAGYIETEQSKRPKKTGMEELMSPTVPILEMTVSNEDIRKAADNDEKAIIAIGRNAGEGNDRKELDDYYLTEKEKTLIREVAAAFHAQNKKVIVTLNIGGVVDVAQWRDQVDAIILAWQPGLEGGNAIADIISGKVNPSGKLATTFPSAYQDDITAKNFPGKEFKDRTVAGLFGQKAYEAEVVYEEGIYVGYRYYNTFNIKPAYEFGYGLSYTDFSFSNLKTNTPVMTDNLQVSVTVINTGSVAGKEVVQLYVSAPNKKLDKPAAELKAFIKTKLLQPGESQEISFTIRPADLASFDTKTSSWIADAGNYTARIGTSQKTVMSSTFKLTKDVMIEKVNKVLVPKEPINELKGVVGKAK
jgi:beta-glucosidase